MTSSLSKTIIAQSKHVETEKNYWLTKLSGTLVRTYFPYDNVAPDASTCEKHDFQVRIPDDLFSRSIQLSKGSDNNLYIILLTCLTVLLNKYTGNKDIIIAVPIFKQEIEGEFINTALAIRIQLTGQETVKELIILCKKTVFEANEYLNFPIERLVNEPLELPFPGDGFSLFETGILLENIQYKKYIEHLNLNILFSFLKTGEYIEGFIEYNSHLYKKDTIKKIGEHFVYLLQIILNNINHQVSGIEILSGEEKHRLLIHFNETKAGIPGDRTIIELFEEQVEKRGDNLALRDGSQVSLKYRDLNERSNQLGIILKEKGVKADTIVALMTGPSVQTIIGILAVLKAGGTYLPIDPEFPAGRINYMLMDSQAHVILTRDHSIEKPMAGGEFININDNIINKGNASNLQGKNTPGDSIYMIYTSGTSGRPKGVLIKNENLVNYVYWFLEKARLTGKDKAMLLSSFAFDLGYTSIYSSLLAGGELHLIPKEIFLIPERLLDYIKENGITYLKLTPSLFSVIAGNVDFSKEKCGSLRLVVLGGEAINTQDLAHANLVCKNLQIMNHYGPTETTIGSVARFIDFNRFEEYKQKPTIGKPIDNTEIYILDENLKPVPVGIPAELCIGGNGVGRGYLNQPELTASKFIAHPFKDEGRIYRTGDRARWNPEGEVEFLGRIDTQIKIRGFRIELEEIENQLLKQESIKNAVVIARQDDNRGMYLCAYYISSNPVEITQLREYLSSKLPVYMIPSVFMELKKIPVTPNGKVDHRALPEPEIETGDDYTAPMDEQQEKLAALWSSVLGIEKEKAGIDANFFELGGDSLKATTLIAKIHKAYNFQLSLIELFKFPTIRGISGIIDKSIEDKFASIEPVEEKDFYPLSSTQKRIYILQQMETGTTSYNVPSILSIEGEVELNRIDEVYKKLISRHEALRTSFVMAGEELVQRIDKEVEFSVRYFEAFHGKEEKEEVVQNFVQPFDLSRAPLMRAGLIKTGEKNYLFYIDMHHILRDAATINILNNEFMALYAGEVLPPLKLHYKDFSEWQNSRRMQEILKKQKKYWQQEFIDQIPVLNLPTDYPRPTNQSFEGSTVSFEISETETMLLNKIARSEGTTLFMLLLALFYVFLCKISSQEDIVVGTPIASRTHADLERIVGMFLNTMAIRNFIPTQGSLKEFLNDVKNKTLKTYDNQDYPFEDLVENVQIQRDLGRNPMFDVMFVFYNVSDDPGNVSSRRVKNLTITNYPFENRTSKFDLTLFSIERRDKLHFFIEYCTRLFKEETVLRFVRYFKKIISSVIEYPGKMILDIEIMSDEEKKKILYDFNDTETGYPKDKTIHRLFEEQVEQTPDNIAIVAPCIGTNHESPQQITYKELNEKSNRLAHELQTKGVGPDTIVGIMIERSLEMLIGILGILKAGGAYMPIDPEFPMGRIDYMLKDTNVAALVTTLDLIEESNKIISWEGEKILLEDLSVPPEPCVAKPPPETLNWSEGHHIHHSSLITHHSKNSAYVIYTSGTTGRPKGTLISHQNLVNFMYWFTQEAQITERDKAVLTSSFAFDLGHTSIYPPLLTGGELHLLPRGIYLSPDKMLDYIYRKEITYIKVTPSLLKIIINSPGFTSKKCRFLRLAVVGGEAIDLKDIEAVYSVYCHLEIMNSYGPTETTVACVTHNIIADGFTDYKMMPTIGKPIANARIYILGRDLILMPVGVPGELFISGAGVGRGYLNRPRLTAERFIRAVISHSSLVISKKSLVNSHWSLVKNKLPKITNDHSNKLFTNDQCPMTNDGSSLLYRTGDLARWLSDENIEFLGRIDHQVKIRGFRIELGEIENCLLKFSGVKEAVVSVREDVRDEKYICAYFVTDSEYEISGVREFLSKELPNYMIPSYFVRLEKIPLTHNRKVDRKALPGPEIVTGESYIAPRDEVEMKLAEIWSEVLLIEKEKIGIDTNFFELGGHSLKATILESKIHKEFEVRVPLAEIFKAPQIETLAGYIKGKSKDIYMSVKSVEKKEYYPLSPAQKRLYILQQMQLDGTAYNMPAFIPLEMDTDLTKIEGAFKKLIARHENFHTSFYMVNDEPVQRVHDEVEFEIEYEGGEEKRQGTEEKNYKIQNTNYKQIPNPKSQIPNKKERCDTAQYPDPKSQELRAKSFISSFIRPFDLSSAPLLRVGLVEPARGGTDTENRHGHAFLVVDMHHIISDGVSRGVLIKDFQALYEGEELQPLRIQYKDFSQWQDGEKEKEKIKHQESYWLKEFTGEIPVLELPTDYPRPKEQSFEGNRVNFEITGEETQGLKAVALKGSSTLFMVLTAVFNILLSKLSGQEDIVIGTPIAGRRHADLEKIIGMFVNTLSLRNYLTGERRFREFLGDLKENTLKAFENQEYQFEELVDKLSVKRDIGRNPLFDVMLVLQNLDIVSAGQDEETEIENSRLNQHDSPGEYENIFQTTKFDLTFTAMERDRGLFFSIRYCTKLFKKETIERYIDYFRKIVSITVKEPGIRLSEIEIKSEEEKNRLLYVFNDTGADYPKDKTIHRLFEEQAARTPDHVALIGENPKSQIPNPENKAPFGQVQLSYGLLNEKSNSLAYMLLDKGMRQETAVGIMVERSVEIIIGILGILKCGGVYLPIDPEFPGGRIDYMLKDSNAKILLTQQEIADLASPKASVIDPEAAHSHRHQSLAPSSSFVYVIYTSGTTGKPKGVAINHENLVNYVNWFTKKFEITGEDKTILTSSLSFDLGYTVLYTSLLKGGELHILQRETYLSAERLLRYIKRKGITYIKVTPSLFSVMVNSPVFLESKCKSLRLAAVGGESINLKDIERAHSICKNLRIMNHYGPTEATIGCIARIIDFNRFEEYKMNPTIGKPIFNTGAYILDKNLNLLPVSVSGELCISGAGIGSGYLNNPELTAEKFDHDLWDYLDDQDKRKKIPGKNHSSPVTHSPIYRTGDLARWVPDGNIEFLGRIDTQVKIRGYRVELGEIENQLLTHHEIKETSVLLRENQKGDKYICAYIVAHHSILLPELREYSSKRLPGYMVPSYFIFLDRIPLTANGKIDRNALPGPEAGEAPEEFQPPGDETEEKLAVIWADVLGIEKEKIGVGQNFFELGGNSLSLVTMVSKIYNEFGREIPITQIYHKPLISEISQLMFTKNFEEDPVVLLNKANTKKIFCFPPQIGYGIFYLSLSRILDDYSFYAFSFIEDLEPAARIKKYVDIITYLQPVGPYILYGYSAAGGLTFQVAKALEKLGCDVSDIIFFDCFFTENNPREVVREELEDYYQYIDELLESMQMTSLKGKVLEKTHQYMNYYRSITHLEKIDANVHLVLSGDTQNNENMNPNCWKHLTSGNSMIYNGFGGHRQMFRRGLLEKNAEIMRGILDKTESGTSGGTPDI